MKNLLKVLLVFLVLSSCSRKEKIDYTIQDIEISRFEKDLFSIPFDSISLGVKKLQKKYDGFFEMYNFKVLGIGSSENLAYPTYLLDYLTHPVSQKSYKLVESKYKDLKSLKHELGDAFGRYIAYFPGKTIPKVYTLMTNFSQSIIIDTSFIAIGLDKYLGADCELYPEIGFSNYQMKNMISERISPDCMRAIAISEFPYNDSVNDLASNMIYNGKLLFFAKTLLPEKPDSIIIGYSSEQLRFCKENEKQMWTFLIENKLLFSTDYMEIKRFTEDAPYTKAFTEKSPGRAANYLGWQIVENYAEKNNLSLSDVMLQNDYRLIMKLSKYKP